MLTEKEMVVEMLLKLKKMHIMTNFSENSGWSIPCMASFPYAISNSKRFNSIP